MTVAVDPVAFWLGGFAIRWYGLIAAAATAATTIGRWTRPMTGHP